MTVERLLSTARKELGTKEIGAMEQLAQLLG